MTIVLLSVDLMGASRVEGAVRQIGADFRLVSTVEAAADFCGAQQPAAMILVDLATPGLDPTELVERLRNDLKPPPPIVAFGPHVQDARLAAAENAGCNEVMSRGEFMAQIREILARNAETE